MISHRTLIVIIPILECGGVTVHSHQIYREPIHPKNS